MKYEMLCQRFKSNKDLLIDQINQIHVDAFNLVFFQKSSFQVHGPRICIEQNQREHESWMEQ